MVNQQPSSYNGIITLAKNAKMGDGYLWRHPECVNSKVIFTSTDLGLLKAKMELCPSIFPAGVSLYRKEGAVTNYCNNSKALYKLASIVHPIFTRIHSASKLSVLTELNEFDFALWYLDDGNCSPRPPKYRFGISIGNAATGECKEVFMAKVRELFGGIRSRGNTVGRIKKNNSKATDNNMTWSMPTPIGIHLSKLAASFYIIQSKCPYVEGSETIPEGSTIVG